MVFFALYFIELLMFYCKMYSMFHVNDGPEGIFLCTETIKLYCIVDRLADCDQRGGVSVVGRWSSSTTREVRGHTRSCLLAVTNFWSLTDG